MLVSSTDEVEVLAVRLAIEHVLNQLVRFLIIEGVLVEQMHLTVPSLTLHFFLRTTSAIGQLPRCDLAEVLRLAQTLVILFDHVLPDEAVAKKEEELVRQQELLLHVVLLGVLNFTSETRVGRSELIFNRL